eukprot:TRINITY_DN2041_c0_g1_i1.p1 TRINITY_DN2041_c0_g1~~TRINITY_DN2041_c0_g1_i1.p1  ORF type:complete len:369 (-),score=94.42 TRINITY_DN2041_c0_g1_i1:876-1982(-)
MRTDQSLLGGSATRKTNLKKILFALSSVGLIAFACYLVIANSSANAIVLNSEDEIAELGEFRQWMKVYNKIYENEEEFLYRSLVFKSNQRRLAQLQAENTGAYTLGLNKFADWTETEFREHYLGFVAPKNRNITFETLDTNDLPQSVDWREQGAVQDVKDQGKCGSCWAFSSTGALEGLHHIKTGQLLNLSEQVIIDCSRDYGNFGCRGGWMDDALYYTQIEGIELEETYPYIASDQLCADHWKQKLKLNTGYKGVKHDLDQVLAAVAQQPISVAIEADLDIFQFYTGGVIDKETCGIDLDHAVLIIGYGTEQANGTNTDYWIVKNSWGPDWGEQGYFRLKRSEGYGICGINLHGVYPTAQLCFVYSL